MTALRIFTPINHLLLSLLGLTTLVGFLRIPADAQLPIHFNIFGEPDRFAGRDDALLLAPAAGILLLLVFWAIGRFAAPERLAGGRHVLDAVLPALLALFLSIQAVLVFQFDFAIARIMACCIAGILIILGNVVPKSQPNRYGGLRLRSTMASAANWAATHRFLGLAMMVAGALLLLLALATGDGVVLFSAILVATILPPVLAAIYSRNQARRDGK